MLVQLWVKHISALRLNPKGQILVAFRVWLESSRVIVSLLFDVGTLLTALAAAISEKCVLILHRDIGLGLEAGHREQLVPTSILT